jgi:hypothetical protein
VENKSISTKKEKLSLNLIERNRWIGDCGFKIVDCELHFGRETYILA